MNIKGWWYSSKIYFTPKIEEPYPDYPNIFITKYKHKHSLQCKSQYIYDGYLLAEYEKF